ncbi:MAG: hypothetical protein V3T59_07260, partial [Desulfobacterales bacterium]
MKKELSPVAEFNLPQVKGSMLRGESWKHILLLGPLVAYLSVFFVYPLVGTLIQSIFDPEFTTEHYQAM